MVNEGLAPPLVRHGVGDAGEEPASLFPAVRTRRHAMDARLAPGHDFRRHEQRQPL